MSARTERPAAPASTAEIDRERRAEVRRGRPLGTHAPLVLAALRGEVVQAALSGRVRLLLAVSALAPAAFVVGATLQTTAPADTLVGRQLFTSGFATPLVVLGFVSAWALPLLVCLVAGDVFSREDAHGTWPTLLTRSASRGHVFAAKVLLAGAVTVVVIALLAVSSTLAGLAAVGTQPLTSLSGTLVPPGRALPLVLAAWATALPPALAYASLAVVLSVVSRSSLVGVAGPVVLGLVMQGAQLVGGADAARHLLLSDALTTWHGLLTAPGFSGPLVRGTAVSAGWALVCLVVAHEVFARRDVVGR